LAVLQAERQAGGADGAGPADCFGCSDLVQRGAIGRDREKQLGILALAGPLDIQPNGPVSASDDIMSKLLEDQGGRGKRAVRPSGATAGRRDRNTARFLCYRQFRSMVISQCNTSGTR
jgi:hypothetical protein